jgi:hypothetical protein
VSAATASSNFFSSGFMLLSNPVATLSWRSIADG